MAQREPKSRTTTSIEVIGRDGSKHGALSISSGNLTYTRFNAKRPSGQWTLQQLLDLLERDIASQSAMNPTPTPLGLSSGDDFKIFLTDTKGHLTGDDNSHVLGESHSLKVFDDARKLDHGTFQIDSPAKRPAFGFRWTVEISVVTALYIINLYIDKYLLVGKRAAAKTTNRPVSRLHMSAILQKWLRAIGA